jgi:dipeptidyl aminopeptidase/acylaminoacyl peptidase
VNGPVAPVEACGGAIAADRRREPAFGQRRLVNRLIELGQPFDAMMYPNRTHAIAEGRGTTTHIHRLIARYFVENLPPGPG